MFFIPKFRKCIIHSLHTGSGETTNMFCTKGEMNSKEDAIYGLTDIIPIVTIRSANTLEAHLTVNKVQNSIAFPNSLISYILELLQMKKNPLSSFIN